MDKKIGVERIMSSLPPHVLAELDVMCQRPGLSRSAMIALLIAERSDLVSTVRSLVREELGAEDLAVA